MRNGRGNALKSRAGSPLNLALAAMCAVGVGRQRRLSHKHAQQTCTPTQPSPAQQDRWYPPVCTYRTYRTQTCSAKEALLMHVLGLMFSLEGCGRRSCGSTAGLQCDTNSGYFSFFPVLAAHSLVSLCFCAGINQVQSAHLRLLVSDDGGGPFSHITVHLANVSGRKIRGHEQAFEMN